MPEFKSNKPKPTWMQQRYGDRRESLTGAQGFDEDRNQMARHPAENEYRQDKKYIGKEPYYPRNIRKK